MTLTALCYKHITWPTHYSLLTSARRASSYCYYYYYTITDKCVFQLTSANSPVHRTLITLSSVAECQLCVDLAVQTICRCPAFTTHIHASNEQHRNYVILPSIKDSHE